MLKTNDVKPPLDAETASSPVNIDVKPNLEVPSPPKAETTVQNSSTGVSSNYEEELKTIPYDRFKEINEQKNEAEMKVKELNEKLAMKKIDDVLADDKIPKNKKDFVVMMAKIAKEQQIQIKKESSKKLFFKKMNIENVHDTEKIMTKIEGIADAIVTSGQTDNYAEALNIAYYIRNDGKKNDERMSAEKTINMKVKGYGISGGTNIHKDNQNFTDSDYHGMKEWGMSADDWKKYSD